MPRFALTAGLCLGLAAWAGAQPPPAPGPSAAEQLGLLKANKNLIDDLIDTGLGLADAGSPLDRAKKCRESAYILSAALRKAVDDGNPDRVAELGDHLESVVRDGLAPNLDEGVRTVPAGSRDAEELRWLRERAGEELDAIRAAIPATGRVGTADRVKAAQERLRQTREQLGEQGRP